MSYVNTPQRGSRTTELLTPAQQRLGRYVAAGAVVLLILAAVVLDIRERRQAAAVHEIQAQYIILIATPTARSPEPTAAPAIVAAPATAAPEIVSQTVEAPIDVEVSSAPVAEPAAPVDAWHPPLVAPGPCADWRPPQPYPAGCP